MISKKGTNIDDYGLDELYKIVKDFIKNDPSKINSNESDIIDSN